MSAFTQMVSFVLVTAFSTIGFAAPLPPETIEIDDSLPLVREPLGTHVALGWNDLGMHCLNGDYSSIAILPPYNNLWTQVIHRRNRPVLVSDGVKLSYRFPANTTNVGKTNFWQYEDVLFGVSLPDGIGLTGNGLAGNMSWTGTAFEVTGVPILPYEDDNLITAQAYQLVEVTLKSEVDDSTLDVTSFVVPVSDEMHCDKCHAQGGEPGGNGTVWVNILDKHDEEHDTSLVAHQPVLCATCHGSNALGMAGDPELPNLSRAIHGRHAEEVGNSMSCYDCHPGTVTKCLRDAMFIEGKTCTDCHGSLSQVASSIDAGRRPWLDEPRCTSCHDSAHGEEAATLYRNSRGHGEMYCAACHNSPHAILPTVQSRDWVQAVRVQGTATYIKDCLVCHTSDPMAAGPHGVITSKFIRADLSGIHQMTSGELEKSDYNEDSVVDSGDMMKQVRHGM